MASRKTESELLFERFCDANQLDYARVEEGRRKVPDYRLKLVDGAIFVEIEQIETRAGLEGATGTRTVGDHVRSKISEARKQLQAVSRIDEAPGILLIYNAVDPIFQSFGTDQLDFLAAMYGELTVRLVNGRAAGSFHGRNAVLQNDKNTSFSGVGHLCSRGGAISVTLYENVYAKRPLPFDHLPACFEVKRIEIED